MNITTEFNDYEIIDTETGVIITRYNGVNKDVVIPEFICGKNVIGLQGQPKKYTFDDKLNLHSITIPRSIRHIGQKVFGECHRQFSIHYLGEVEDWCRIHFEPIYCRHSLYINTALVKELVIPNTVTEIYDNAFYNIWSITDLTIGYGVKQISPTAFRCCTNLKSITVVEDNRYYSGSGNCLIEKKSKTLILGCQNSVIPADGSATMIDDYAFDHCHNLIRITIPKCINFIGETTDQTFDYCFKLVEVCNLSPIRITAGWQCDGRVAWYAKNVFTPPNGQSRLFKTDNGFTLYDDGERFWVVAYDGEEQSIEIPSFEDRPVTTIYRYAFYNKYDLTQIIVSNSVDVIEMSAFGNCEGLKSIHIGENVRTIDSAFSGCINLESISVDKKNAFYYSAGNCLISKNRKAVELGCKNSIIPRDKDIVSIGYGAFENCIDLQRIVIPKNIVNINASAFHNCYNLDYVEIQSTIKLIGSFAFQNCGKLKTIKYNGTTAQWNAISKGVHWNDRTAMIRVICSDAEIIISQ